MNVILCAAMGYLIGNINPAYILGRQKGFDIRGRGSGNAGASNATLVMGKAAGLFCALFDIFKSYLACRLAKLLFPFMVYAGVLAGLGCVLGHVFPFWMKFNGGKGLASMGGMILAHDWRLFLIMLAAEIALVLIVNYLCVMPLSAALVFPVIYGFQTGDLTGALLLTVLIPVVFYKHLPNLRRIACGQEMHVSWLWKPQSEESRIRDQYTDEEWARLHRKGNQKD